MTLINACRARLPESVAIAERDPRQSHPLLGNEAQMIARAVPARRAEFSAGRDAARDCLRQLGMPAVEIAAENRAPIWPAGSLGSITHSKTACLAVVARSDDLDALGVDIEPDAPLPASLLDSVLNTDEQAFASDARAAFSMKEAVYKALSPHLPRILEFHDLILSREDDDRISATLTTHAGPFAKGARFGVHCCRAENHVLSLCWLPKGHIPC